MKEVGCEIGGGWKERWREKGFEGLDIKHYPHTLYYKTQQRGPDQVASPGERQPRVGAQYSSHQTDQ